MLGFLFLVVATLTGAVLVQGMWSRFFAPALDKSLSGSPLPLAPWVVFWPASWLLGTLLLTWATYFWASEAHSMVEGTVGVLSIAFVVLLAVGIWCARRGVLRQIGSQLPRPAWGLESLYTAAVFAFAMFIAWRTFWVEDGALRIGVTVFSDFGPHLAVIRSFSEGINFPPQYPHFADGTMRYHFMFQFHVAMLEVLGLRLDWAFNVASALSLTSCLMLLYALAVTVTGSRMAGVIAGILFSFRSSLAVITHALAQREKPDFWQAFWNPTVFIGATPNENWGLFAQNVYANQRHLAFSLAFLWLVLLWVMPLLRARVESPRSFSGFCLGLNNWWPKDFTRAVVVGVVLGSLAYWNGAVVVTALLVLAGIGLFSKHRLELAIVAVLTIALSTLQWRFFAGSDVSSPAPRWVFGFLAEQKTLSGVAHYYIELLGLLVPLFILASVFSPRGVRAFAFASVIPLVWATTMLMTIDMNANHKFVMIAVALCNIGVAGLLVRLWQLGRVWARSVFLVLMLALTASGVIDLRTLQIMNRNYMAHRFDEPTLDWVRRNTRPGEVFLTHWTTLNPILLAGRPIYFGWPYFAWSAGHPTENREKNYKALFGATDPASLASLARREGIDYIVVEWENRRGTDYPVNEQVIAATFPLVFSHVERDMRIYRVAE